MTRALTALLATLALAGCRQDMHDQPRHEPLERSAFFADGRSARPRVAGTVARGERPLDEHLHTGRVGGELATSFPMEITREVMERGRERYDVFCSPCHGFTGTGNGMIVQRGMKQPPSLLIDRLRDSPPGYHFEVITRGFGVMFDYADRIAVHDRWAIVAYLQALELSGTALAAELAEADRAQLED